MDAEILSQQRFIAALERSSNLQPAGDVDDESQVAETVAVIDAVAAKIQANDFSAVESVVAGQALALDVIFSQHARQSARKWSVSYRLANDAMRIALKAQAQCRSTLETLASLKKPPRTAGRRANGGAVQDAAFFTEQTGEKGNSPA